MGKTSFWLLLSLLLLAGCQQGEEADSGSGLGKGPGKKGKAAPPEVIALSPATAGTGFVSVPSSTSGIDFENTAQDPSTYTLAAGLASGDYDGDADLDLYFCGLDSKNKLYQNDGGLKFTDVTDKAGAGLDGGDTGSISANFVDVSGDGKLDLYVSNRLGANQLFTGDGKGGFTADSGNRGLTNNNPATAAAFFDADNDGDLDCYLATYYPDYEPVRVAARKAMVTPTDYSPDSLKSIVRLSNGENITEAEMPAEFKDRYYVSEHGDIQPAGPPDQFFLNDGKGNFSDSTSSAGLDFRGWSLAAHACDINNDGWTDLYVASDFLVNDKLFINDKDGTFTDRIAELNRKNPWYSMGVDSGDLNNDGLPDLITSDMLSKDYKRGKRQSGDMYFGRNEMLYDEPQPQMRNMLFVNRGDGWMTEMGQMAGVAASEWTWSARMADLDSNGKTDIYMSNGMLYDAMDVDFQKKSLLLAVSLSPEATKLHEELLAAQEPYFSDDFIFTADEGETYKFSQAKDNWGLHDASMGCGVSLADYDGDGDLDIIMNNTNMPAGVWRNDVPQGNQVLVDLRQDGPNPSAYGARVWAHCGDTTYTADAIASRGYATGESGRLHFGLGDNATIDKLVIRWPDMSQQEYDNLAAGNLYVITKAKGLPQWQPEVAKPMFTQAALPFKQTEQDTQKAEFEKEILLPLRCSLFGTGAGSADYDGDGNLDLYFAGAAGQSGQLLKGDGKGGFTADTSFAGAFPKEAEEMAVLWFDADGDGRQDLLVTAGGMESPVGSANYGVKLFRNGTDGFKAAPLPARTQSTASACAADVNGDGALDLFLAGHLVPYRFMEVVPSALWLNDGKGGFKDGSAQYLAALNKVDRQVTDAQFADMTGDGKADLVLARFYGAVELWAGDGKTFAKKSDLTGTGWWRSLGIGDFNADGKQDVIAGNLGKDTKYSPKDKQPVTMFMADFDKNGVRDSVEVKFAKIDGKDCVMPGRGRSCSGYAISYIPTKWPTWASFANATLEEVYGPGMKGAKKYEASMMTSEICLNNGDGTFSADKLHGSAQWAPVFGIAVGDFNCDGMLDAFLGNNFEKPQPETGSWQTGYGVLMLGDGKGGLEDVAPAESGLHLWNDNRTVLAADFNSDSQLDLAVSMSNAEAQLGLRTTEDMGGQGLLVKLKSKAPNTAGVGSTVTLTLSDGRTLSRTVQAGSGYLGSLVSPVHFGVPEGATATKVDVTWADGSTSSSSDVTGSSVEVAQQ